jgi:hypothetical protein
MKGCRLRPLALVLGLVGAAALRAQPVPPSLPFSGRWLLDEGPATAGYTVLTVKEAGLTWSVPGKAPPPCTQDFTVQQEKPGTVYLDGRGKKFVAGVPGSIPTYLLKLVGGNCRGIEEALRIHYPLVYDVGHIEVIEYVKGRPVSARRFHRAPGGVTPSGSSRRGSTGGHRGPRSPGRP